MLRIDFSDLYKENCSWILNIFDEKFTFDNDDRFLDLVVIISLLFTLLPLFLAKEISLPNLRNRASFAKVSFSKKYLMSELGFFF